jgi:single-strand DNA-binding protein
MINIVTLKGNLGNDPEFKITQVGKEMATFSLATSYSWKDSEGEWHTHVDWHRVTVFNEPTVKWMKGVLRKGDVVDVVGRLMYKKWVDKHGQKRMDATVVGVRGACVHLMRDTNLAPINETVAPTFEINTQHEEVESL